LVPPSQQPRTIQPRERRGRGGLEMRSDRRESRQSKSPAREGRGGSKQKGQKP
jgi:hypothetical protein